MKHIFIVLASIFIFSCNPKEHKANADSLKQWMLDNHDHLENDIETIIKNDLSNNEQNPNWFSSSIATTMYASNSLGKLAKIASDSTECVVVELTFYKDKMRKTEIMIAAADSSCIEKLNAIKLKTDSIGNVIFGKAEKPLY